MSIAPDDFTPPPDTETVPSDVLSPTPKPPSWFSPDSPFPPSRHDRTISPSSSPFTPPKEWFDNFAQPTPPRSVPSDIPSPTPQMSPGTLPSIGTWCLPVSPPTPPIGSRCRPIIVSPSTPPGVGTRRHPIVVSPGSSRQSGTKKVRSSRKGKGRVDRHQDIVVSNDNAQVLSNSTLPGDQAVHSVHDGPVRRIVIIDDAGDAHGNGRKKVKHYHMSVHTMQRTMPTHQPHAPSPLESIVHDLSPLSHQQYNIRAFPAEDGAAGPSGSTVLPSAGPSFSNPTSGTKRARCLEEDTDYEYSDIEPDLLASLCEGL